MLEDPKIIKPNPVVNFLAAGVSGVIAKTLTAPVEKVKLTIQTQDANPIIMSGEMKRYKGIYDCTKRHVKELGVMSLWRGNVANCIRYVPNAGQNLMLKDTIKRAFPVYNKNTEFKKFAATQVLCGSVGSSQTNFIVYPLVYARVALGCDIGKVKQFNGVVDCIRKTAKTNGFLAIYKGILPSTCGTFVYRGIQFGCQDTIKAFNPYQNDFTIIGLGSKFFVAQFACFVSGFPGYPLDTVIRRLQNESTKPQDQQIYSGTYECAKKILKYEGMGAFYKGFLANVLRTVGSALVLVFYDEIMSAYSKKINL